MIRLQVVLPMLLCLGLIPVASDTAETAFCQKGSVSLMTDHAEPSLQSVAANCKVGDVIAIPPGGGGGSPPVARLCDFSKSITIAGGVMYCVLVPLRPLR